MTATEQIWETKSETMPSTEQGKKSSAAFPYNFRFLLKLAKS